MSTATPTQKPELLQFASAVPNGLLIEKGVPGTGKTTALNMIIESQWRQYLRVSCFALTNSAVNNFMARAIKQSKEPDSRLFIRMWSPNMEYRAIRSRSSGQLSPDSLEPNRYLSKLGYQWEGSMGAAACQLAGVEPTQNQSIRKLRNHKNYEELGKFITMPMKSRKARENNRPKHLVSEAVADLIKAAHGIFMTLTRAGSV
jgi:hypothetical protein